jgi:L-galactose dehydrogenase
MYLEAECLLGHALAGVPRESYVLATKFFPADETGAPLTPMHLRRSVEQSLRRLRVEALDVLQLHGLRPHWHPSVMDALGAELERLRNEGRFRFLGAAETIVEDPRHEMVPPIAPTNRFAMALVAYPLLSPWAETAALTACQRHGLGVVAMVAVRRALRDPAFLQDVLRAARARGEPGIDDLPAENPLDWLLDGHAPTLAAAGYRFAVAHPAVSSVLAGTLSPDHLHANVAAVCAPPMPASQLDRIRRIFLRTNPEHWKPFDL